MAKPTWRDYSLHQYGTGENDVSVLCRSDGGCEDFEANAEGRYLTLGEAVDWAQKHTADHAKWDAEVAAEAQQHIAAVVEPTPTPRPTHPLAAAVCGCPLYLDSKLIEHSLDCTGCPCPHTGCRYWAANDDALAVHLKFHEEPAEVCLCGPRQYCHLDNCQGGAA